jgi:soluble lytic murein transglycosylase-like protein
VGQVLVIRGSRVGRGRSWHQRRRDGDDAPGYRAAPAPASQALASAFVYMVRLGDTLSAIGVRFGVGQQALVAANPGVVLDPLRAGLRLNVPAPRGGAAGPAQEPGQAGTPVATPAATPMSSSAPAPAGQAGTIAALLTAQAQAAGVSVALVKAVAWQESGWQMVMAADGGIGVMQLMPATVAWISSALLGYRLDPYNAAENIHGGVALLAYYLRVFAGDQRLAIAAYHQGLASVRSQGINANTAAYLANVLALEQRFAG